MLFLTIISTVLSIIAISKASTAIEKADMLQIKLNVAGKALGLIQDIPNVSNDLSVAPEIKYTDSDSVNAPVSTQPNAEYIYEESDFSKWIKDNWLMKLGVILVLTGFVWALGYAYTAKYLTDGGISVLGVLTGATFITFGFVRARSYITQGSIFMLMGTGLTILTVYFMDIKKVIDSPTVLMLIALSVLIITAAAAVLYNRKSLAVSALILAIFVPVILDSWDKSYLSLYIYLTVVVLGTIWIVALTRWSVTTLTALLGVCFYGAAGISSGFGQEKDVAFIFGFIFAAIFFTANTVSIIKDKKLDVTLYKKSETTDSIDLITPIINVVMLCALILNTTGKEWHALLLSMVAIIFILTSYVIYLYTKKDKPVLIYLGIGVAIIGYVTFLLLGDSYKALAIAYTLEIAIMSILVYLLQKDVVKASRVMILLFLPIILMFDSVLRIITATTSESVYNYNILTYIKDIRETSGITYNLGLDYLVITFFMIVTIGLATFYKSTSKRLLEKSENVLVEKSNFQASNDLINIIYMANAVLALAIIWGICALVFGVAAVSISLMIYAAIGVAVYVYGKNANQNNLKNSGTLLIGLTTLWLISILASSDNPIYKILGFVVVGAVLLSSAFLLKNKS